MATSVTCRSRFITDSINERLIIISYFLFTKLRLLVVVTKFLERNYFRDPMLNLLIFSSLKNVILPIFQLSDFQAVTLMTSGVDIID